MAWIVGYITKLYSTTEGGEKGEEGWREGLGNMERMRRFSRVKGFEWEHV